MNKKDVLANVTIVLLVIAIILVVLMKFVLTNSTPHRFSVTNLQEIMVFDLNKNTVKFADLISGSETRYCMVFDMRDCPSCIIKGLDDLKQMRAEGKRPIILGIFNSIEELGGWANVNECQDIYLLKKSVFYENFNCETTPVIIRFKNSNAETFRYILP